MTEYINHKTWINIAKHVILEKYLVKAQLLCKSRNIKRTKQEFGIFNILS